LPGVARTIAWGCEQTKIHVSNMQNDSQIWGLNVVHKIYGAMVQPSPPTTKKSTGHSETNNA